MRRFPIYLTLTVLLSCIGIACNDKDSDEIEGTLDHSGNNVMVTSFSLGANEDILAGLDSVFFTVDLDNALIYNADSLPKGTSVRKLVVNIGLPDVKEATITMPGSQGADTVVNYLTNASDSINFVNGSVKLHLLSANSEVERNYTIKVNVHKLDPDLLAWGSSAWNQLPTTLSTVKSCKAIEFAGLVHCFTANDTQVCHATSGDPTLSSWTMSATTLPAGADLNTLTAGDGAIYLCTSDGKLYSSSDQGTSWSDTGVAMNSIYGNYDGTLIGAHLDTDGKYYQVTYPASTATALPADMPVTGMSGSILYTSKWASAPQLMFLGGVSASGKYSGDCWTYDGNEWIKSSISPVAAGSGYSLIPYFTFKTSTSWVVTEQTVLLAMGSSAGPGLLQRNVYISYDRGVHWAIASDNLQLPSNVMVGSQASALVLPATIQASTSAWHNLTLPSVPRWFTFEQSHTSRAVTPITQWECPYIYIIGGYDANGNVSNKIWRGVINRLSFKPLQ